MTDLPVVLASDNAGKLIEFSAILADTGIRIINQGKLGVKPVPEPHVSFIENALTKARHAAQVTGMPALADDSGLCVNALNYAPGVYSARFAAMAGGEKSDAANNAYLLQQLNGVTNRQASYIAVLVFLRFANDPRPIIVEGEWQGEILESPRGNNGFGYDPLFYLPDLGQTAAQLHADTKNQHSHRGKALKELLSKLKLQANIK